MDLRVRQNEFCIVGQPSCGYYLNSSRSCFIGYGFGTSDLEVDILAEILSKRNFESINAGASINSGQNLFCTKICSKIIASRFCIILVNNDEKEGHEQPNANVHMEYGLMLAFNKYVIPFQRDDQKLAFNVAGLDTVKYTAKNFKALAEQAIDKAISITEAVPVNHSFAEVMQIFLMSEGYMFATLSDDTERGIFDRGKLLGYSLIHNLTGTKYVFLGDFSMNAVNVIQWKIQRTMDIFNGLMNFIKERVNLGLAAESTIEVANKVIGAMETWILVTDIAVESAIKNFVIEQGFKNNVKVLLLDNVVERLKSIESGEFYN